MTSSNHSAPAQVREHDSAFRATFAAAKLARAHRVKVSPHRSLTPLKLTPFLLAQTIVLALVLCGLLFWAKPMLLGFWRDYILLWSGALHLPFTVVRQLNDAGVYTDRLSSGLSPTPLPGTTTMAVTAVVTLLGLVLSMRLDHAKLPLKYPLRIVCVIQAVTLAYFWLWPTEFPYTVARHSEELMTIGYMVMLATPLMLAVGYYILKQSLAVKLFHTALILLFFTIMVPHQVLVQAFLMQHLSVLFMPVLYICFGAVFDALIFVALYSWAVSKAPANATF